MVDAASPKQQQMQERMRARQEERRKARNMSKGTSKSPKTASSGTSASDTDKFTLVRDDTAADASDSGIVYISTQLINNGNDRVRRRVLESDEEN